MYLQGFVCKEMFFLGLPWWSSGYGSELPVQGPRVPALVGS